MVNILQLSTQNGTTHNLQGVTIGVHPGEYIFDRYAQSIVDNNHYLYDAIEVHGVRNYDVGIDDAMYYEIDNLNPTCFSVYFHLKDGAIECVGDFTFYDDAVQYGIELNNDYKWPMRDFVLKQHRKSTLSNLQ